MADKSVDNNVETVNAAELLKEMKEFSLTVGEDCPEGHRRDPGSGRCLPISGLDHTAFNRSKNVDYGPEWRGEDTKSNTTFADEDQEVAIDAADMEELESCAEGMTFSFIQKKCISLEEAEAEDSDEFAMTESGEYIEEEAAAPGQGGHEEITMMQPEGRRDTVNHECPPNMIFDYKRRECIPLNKDTLMASVNSLVESFGEDKPEVAQVAPGISPAGRDRLSQALMHLVADNFAMTVKGYNFHWNIVGDHFADLHAMFGADYECLLEQADQMAERVRALGFSAPGSLEDFQRMSSIPDQEGAPEWRAMVEEWVRDHEHMAAETRTAQRIADEVGDNNTLAMLDCKVLFHNKRAWMFGSILAEAPVDFPGRDRMEEIYAKAAKITTKQRKALPDSSFGVPGKRKFPLDTCARVRNAMARFNQSKGLTSGEKATLRRKILSRAKACGIEVRNFAKAVTAEEFAEVAKELMVMVVEPTSKTQKRMEAYRAAEEAAAKKQGPCPPGMEWDAEALRCGHTAGFVKEISQHSEIVRHQPEGRRDPVGFKCPDGWFFDFTNRRCLPLDPSQKPGTTTTKADDEDAQSRDLVPNPKGKPAKLPQDCPPGTIWDKKKEDCVPLDSSKKTKSEEEDAAIPPQFMKNIKKKKGKNGKDGKDGKDGKGMPPWLKKKSKSEDEDAQTTAVGPGKEKDDHGCDPATQAYNMKTGKCESLEKSEEKAEHAQPSNREGLTPAPAGKARLPSDCPPGTAWDAKNKLCRPIDSTAKNRPSGSSPQNPKNTASVDEMSTAVLIKHLDEIMQEKSESGEEKAKVKTAAKDLPNEAFPPSLVGPTRRVFMHHALAVEDPYDNETVDVGRLRNALARSTSKAPQDGFSEQAVLDGVDHLLYHARAIVRERVEKKD